VVKTTTSNPPNLIWPKVFSSSIYLENFFLLENAEVGCSHAAECVNNLPSVFKLSSRPWINPDAAEVEEIVDTIRKCPSGALSYSIDSIEYGDQNDRNPMVTVSKDGPYVITGRVELMGDNIRFGDGASKEHYTLCRCGASNIKPFCDGMHKVINFKDDKN